MDIIVKGHEFFYDITSVSMLFFPGEKTEYVHKSNKDVYIRSYLKTLDTKQVSITKFFNSGKCYSCQKTAPISESSKDLVKYTFYIACSKATDIKSPWGTLTGIRPLSVFERLNKSGYNPTNVLKNKYLLSDDKIDILRQISSIQNSSVSKGSRDVSVYLSIPFCPSKCSYCSFISVSAVNKSELLDKYIILLKEEIKLKSNLIKKFRLNVRSLYIGGGTPGVLSCTQLEDLLKSLQVYFDFSSITEKCFEIGRPDTVSDEKLFILKNYGFDRICINTQSTSDDILRTVNRQHSSSDYFASIESAKQYNFRSINTDLIAGLPGESVLSFKKSVDDVISTGINNITVHTLAIKRSAKLSETDEYYNPSDSYVNEMLDYAYDKLKENNYVPYYIYRQKNCVSNGENVGFCKSDFPCLYNIYMMEDVHSIIACGAGASSKIVNGTTVQRVINVKYPMDYVADYDKIHSNIDKLTTLLKAVYGNE